MAIHPKSKELGPQFIRKARNWGPDIVIGHNLGSLAVINKIGDDLNVPAIFDAEDFHRGEVYWVEQRKEKEVIIIENNNLPKLIGMTAASPLIALEYAALYPSLDVVPVNNAFPSIFTHRPTAKAGELKIVWFSQVTGLGRGLQQFIQGMNRVQNIPIRLEIIGQAEKSVIHTLTQIKASSIHHLVFQKPMPESKLIEYLTHFEIGLTLEIPHPKSRDICRANKLYTYPIAGCFMFISETKGQIEFLKEWPCTGRLVDLKTPKSIGDAIQWAYDNRAELLKKRLEAWELTQTDLNWENESLNLVNMIRRVLQRNN